MKKKLFLIMGVLLISELAISQYFTIEDITAGRRTYLKPQDIQNLGWNGNSDTLTYTRNDSLIAFSATAQQEFTLLTLTEINGLLDKNDLSGLNQFPVLVPLRGSLYYFTVTDNLAFLDIDKKILIVSKIPIQSENITIEPQTAAIAFTLGKNIFIKKADQDPYSVTNDSANGIFNGTSVYRNEFGMVKGIFWSPAGNYLAYYRKNEAKVGEYPLVTIQEPFARVMNIRYPMAGTASEETQVWIYSMADHTRIQLQIPGEPDAYHTNLSWSPDEKYIYLQHLNRGQDTMILRRYSPVTGSLINDLFIETDIKYVEPLFPLVFSGKNPEDFLYLSEHDGYNHIYSYESSANKLIQLTEGQWEVTELLGFDASERSVFFIGTKTSPLERHLYKYDRVGDSISTITSEAGTHDIRMNNAKTLFIDRFTSSSVPLTIQIVDDNGDVVKDILRAPDPLESYSLGTVSIGTITAADTKTVLYYRLTKPVDFDSTQKYPVIVYVYGGPHVQLITNSWLSNTDYLHQYYAQHGIVSFELDCRGSDARGREFEDIIHRQLGIPQIEDQLKGIEFLKKYRWIDTARIGIEGWSFGGYMTISMMVHYPGILKVGVAGGPVTDWGMYEVMYGERYMDRPDQNPVGYENTNINLLAGNLQGKLLMIHGALDNVVVWQNSLVFLQNCIDQDKQVDYFVYPTEEHNVSGKERVHLTTMTTRYFLENL